MDRALSCIEKDMTLTRPHRTLLNWIWQGVILIRQVYRWNAQRRQTRRQSQLMTHSTITVPSTPITPLPVELPVEPSTLTPTERETLQVSEAVSQQMVEPIHLPIPIPSVSTEDSPSAEQPPQSRWSTTRHSRTQLVMSLLDEAWGQGMTTYPQLIAYVAAQSGTGCSKRVVAQWKRERGLLDENP
jgi:ribosomal protein S10